MGLFKLGISPEDMKGHPLIKKPLRIARFGGEGSEESEGFGEKPRSIFDQDINIVHL